MPVPFDPKCHILVIAIEDAIIVHKLDEGSEKWIVHGYKVRALVSTGQNACGLLIVLQFFTEIILAC